MGKGNKGKKENNSNNRNNHRDPQHNTYENISFANLIQDDGFGLGDLYEQEEEEDDYAYNRQDDSHQRGRRREFARQAQAQENIRWDQDDHLQQRGVRQDNTDTWAEDQRNPDNNAQWDPWQNKDKGGDSGWNEQPDDWDQPPREQPTQNFPPKWDGDYWGESAPDGKKNGKGKGKGRGNHQNQGNMFQGAWGNGVDQQAMQNELLREIARSAPPPKGPEFGPLPSRTLALARNEQGKPTIVPAPPGSGETSVRFVESGGAALKPAEKALFSRNRLAEDRLHWLFSPHKDVRVAELLAWIQNMSFGLTALGVRKFIETGERGALVTNVEYRSRNFPVEPAFDWFPWSQANATFDRILQQQLAYYKPESEVLVFVFLLSKSQNSMAIWRKKLVIPTSIRMTHRELLRKKLEESKRENMVIRIDDKKPAGASAQDAVPEQPQAKKKWFRFAA